MGDLVDELERWWALMAVYGGGLVVLGILLHLGWAKDQWFYALVVAVLINMFKMYRYNCVKQALVIKGSMLRALAVLRRQQAHTA